MYHNFPEQISGFVGRELETTTIASYLTDSSCRLLTLVGPGGIGKTRLAMKVAFDLHKHFQDGVYFIPLQALTKPALLVYAIADVLGVGLYEQEAPHRQLTQYLQRRHSLLVLDNFEHLLDAVALLSDILHSAPDTKLLVSSRQVLNLQAEQVLEVSGLPLPSKNQASPVEPNAALRLFAERAQRLRHDFSLEDNLSAAIDICRLVEGTPLAIELAASWVRRLSCAAIADEIAKNIDFLTTALHDISERHHSMRAVFDHSWNLLIPEEQLVFRRLSIFQGKFTLAAAEAVSDASLSVLSALLDQSLLRVGRDGSYSVHELLRQFAEEKLTNEAQETAEIRERHSRYYLILLRELDSKIKGSKQLEAIHEIDIILDNVRSAWQYAAESHWDELLSPVVECLTLYYQMRCRLGEGYEAFDLATRYITDKDSILYAVLLLSKCWFAGFGLKVDEGEVSELLHHAAAILDHNHVRGVGAMTTNGLWRVSSEFRDRITQENLLLYRQQNNLWGIAWTLQKMGGTAYHLRDTEKAKLLLAESIATFARIGDRWGATWAQALLGLIAEDEGNYQLAYELYLSRLRSCEQIGDAGGVAWSLQQIAKVSVELNDLEKARFYCRASLRVALDISTGNSVNEAIQRIAFLFARMNQLERAAELYTVLYNNLDTSTYHWRRIQHQFDKLKTELSSEAIERASQKIQWVSTQELAWVLLDELSDEGSNTSKVDLPVGHEALSKRELEVLSLAATGLSNREIASRLYVSVGTVKKHLNNIFGKLEVDRRTEAIARAHEQQLLS